MDVRKIVIHKEIVLSEAGTETESPIRRVAAMAVFENPYAGQWTADLSVLFQRALEIGQWLMGEAVPLLPEPVVSYGKAAIVGVEGDLEHGAAVLHPTLGKPVRAALGGGESLIPSAAKVAAAGTAIDVPLGHKDDAWSFDHFDSMTVSVPDAPRPREILLAVAIADGGRPNPRVGKQRLVT